MFLLTERHTHAKIQKGKGGPSIKGNICKFVPIRSAGDNALNTIHFVYETNPQAMAALRLAATHIVGLVTSGMGSLEKSRAPYALQKGDLFFIFPDEQYSIINQGDLSYIYIDYVGARASKNMESLKIRREQPVYQARDTMLSNFWEHALQIAHHGNLSMLSESVLLYTFSVIGNTMLPIKQDMDGDITARLQKYVNANFHDPALSLDSVSRAFSYSRKYLSNVFREKTGVKFSQYLKTIRIQHACFLMEQGFSCVKDIAQLCGFEDPMYFSREFKKLMGLCPRQHIQTVQKNKESQE